MTVLHQLNAAITADKTKVTAAITKLLREVQQPDLFFGMNRNFVPRNEDDAGQPSQSKRVQRRATDALDEMRTIYSPLFDMVYRQEVTNTIATADVIVDGNVLLPQVHVVVLMFLEKRMQDIRTFVANIPTLTSDDEWHYDTGSGEWRTNIVQTVSMRRTKQAIVLAPATDKHPAQTQLVDTEVVWGTWDTQKLSTALPNDEKRAMISKIDSLLSAVRDARQRANMTAIPSEIDGKVEFASAIFNHLFR